MKLKSKWIMGGVGFVILLATVMAYEVVLPNRYANDYKNDLQAKTKTLDTALWETSNTLSMPVFSGGNTEPKENGVDLNKIESVISKNKVELTKYRSSAELKAMPLSGYTASYRNVEKIQEETNRTSKEIDKRLSNYQELVSYFLKTNKVDQTLNESMTDFSKLSSGVDPATSIAATQNNAKVIRKAAQDYEQITPPKEFIKDHSGFISRYYKLADALDERVESMQSGDYNRDVAATDKVNQIGAEMDNTSNAFAKKLMSSQTIKNIRELPKLAK